MKTLVSETGGIPAVPVWKEILRWAALFPGAILGAILTDWMMRFCVVMFSARYGNDSWGYALWTESAIHGSSGAAWIYCAVSIAPRRAIAVAMIFVLLGILITGFGFCLAVTPQYYWQSLRAIIFFNVAAIITLILVVQGEVLPYGNSFSPNEEHTQ